MKNTQQGFGTVSAIIVIVLIVIAGLWITGDKDSEKVAPEASPIETAPEVSEEVKEEMAQEEVYVDEEGFEAAPVVEGEQAVSGGSYTDYSDGVLAQGPDTQVLFFHAAWCSSCRTLEKNILDEQSLPDGVAVYKVDYDSNPDLKAQYGVRVQHTLVQVDREGNVIKQWSGGNSTESILKKIQA